jgi:serine acetyltransferase
VPADGHVNIGVDVTICGHVEIGDDVNIAPRAVVGNGRPGRPLRIGAGAVLGVGAVVTRDVPAGARMVGNPAMTLQEWARLRRLLRSPRA